MSAALSTSVPSRSKTTVLIMPTGVRSLRASRKARNRRIMRKGDATQGCTVTAAGLADTTEIGVGDPANTLVDIVESTGCDMIVIGARGQGAISSALLGSVSQALVHASPVPVTIVKHAEVVEFDGSGEEEPAA